MLNMEKHVKYNSNLQQNCCFLVATSAMFIGCLLWLTRFCFCMFPLLETVRSVRKDVVLFGRLLEIMFFDPGSKWAWLSLDFAALLDHLNGYRVFGAWRDSSKTPRSARESIGFYLFWCYLPQVCLSMILVWRFFLSFILSIHKNTNIRICLSVLQAAVYGYRGVEKHLAEKTIRLVAALALRFKHLLSAYIGNITLDLQGAGILSCLSLND